MAGLLEIPYLDFLTIEDLILKRSQRLADDKNVIGNNLYKLKNYEGSLAIYNEVINLCPEKTAYYGKRSACYIMLGMFKKALEDAQMSVALDSKYIKGYIRIAKCCVALGDVSTGKRAVQCASELRGTDCVSTERFALKALQNLYEDAQQAIDIGDYRRVIVSMELCLHYYPSNLKAKLIKAECLALLGRCKEARELANECLRFDDYDTDAIYVRGLCLYLEDKHEHAFELFQEVLLLEPDHRKTMNTYTKGKLLTQTKAKGNEAFKMGRWQQALNLYNEALTIDKNNKTVNAKLYFNKATVCSKLNQTKEAVEACTAALELDENYVKALLRRAKCYTELGEYEEAVQDYESLHKIDKREEYEQLLHKAQIVLEKFNRNDYYVILGVHKSASTEDIKKGYKKRAMLYHPDRHVGIPENQLRNMERRFKQVVKAYTVLINPKERANYDRY